MMFAFQKGPLQIYHLSLRFTENVTINIKICHLVVNNIHDNKSGLIFVDFVIIALKKRVLKRQF